MACQISVSVPGPETASTKGSTFVYLPVPLAMKPHPEQPVLGIVPLFASRTHQVPTPRCSLTVVVFGHGKGRSAAAGHQEHAKVRILLRKVGIAVWFHTSSTAASELFFLLFACKTFFLSRSDLGVTSTN